MDHSVDVRPGASLLDVLRLQLGLTGSKDGCHRGECGACTVLVDGHPRVSCITLAHEVDGEVTTIEGLIGPEVDELRALFADHVGFQCGYCTPGQIVSAIALLRRSQSSPSEAEVREALAGNICRCTGYLQIVESVVAVNGVTSR